MFDRPIRTAGVLLLVSPWAAVAESLPEFHAQTCARRATHIVVVDGKGAVQESWKGDLDRGAALPLVAFGLPTGEKWLKQYGDVRDLAEPPKEATGNRIVLFLVRSDRIGGDYHPKAGWSAAWFGEFNVSAAWIEGGVAYVLSQRMNPGPQVIAQFGTEADLKEQVSTVLTDLKKQYQGALRLFDEAKRAEALNDLLRDGTSYDNASIEQLKDCGKAGVEKLAKFADGESCPGSYVLPAAVALVEVGPAAREAVLGKIDAEVKHWTDYPWQGREIRGNAELQQRAVFLQALFENPDVFRDLPAGRLTGVRAARDLCAKYPALDDRGPGRSKLTLILDRILAAPAK